MFFVLILFLFLCLCFLNTKPSGILKKTKKYKIKISKKRYVSKLLNLKHKFLICENLNIKELKTVDEILFRLQTNCPKHWPSRHFVQNLFLCMSIHKNLLMLQKNILILKTFKKTSLTVKHFKDCHFKTQITKCLKALNCQNKKSAYWANFQKMFLISKRTNSRYSKTKKSKLHTMILGKLTFWKCFAFRQLVFNLCILTHCQVLTVKWFFQLFKTILCHYAQTRFKSILCSVTNQKFCTFQKTRRSFQKKVV